MAQCTHGFGPLCKTCNEPLALETFFKPICFDFFPMIIESVKTPMDKKRNNIRTTLMPESQIREMLSDLIEEIDYDIWKAYFVYCDGLDEDEYDEEGNGTASLEPLIKIVQKHLKKVAK